MFGIGGILGWFYLFFKGKQEEEEKAQKRKETHDRIIAKYNTPSDNPDDYAYDLWEARIKKYCDQWPSCLHIFKCNLALLAVHRKNNSPLGKDLAYFEFFKNIEVTDEELEEFKEVKQEWEDKVYPGLKELEK